MATDSSTYVGDKLLNWLKGTAFGAAPASHFASLWNGDPNSGGTEVTGTINLVRVAVTFGAVAARAMSNSADASFGTANASGTVTFVAGYDSGTAGAGNQLWTKSISSTAISNGLAVKIITGNLTLSY